MTKSLLAAGLGAGLLCGNISAFAATPAPRLLNEPVDVSGDFRDFANTYYLADKLAQFDPATASGKITWQRAEYVTKQAFNNMLGGITPIQPNEFSCHLQRAPTALFVARSADNLRRSVSSGRDRSDHA